MKKYICALKNGYILLPQNLHLFGNEMIATKTADGEFGLIEETNVSVFTLNNGSIVETKTEFLNYVSGAEKVDDKFYTYSYKLVLDDEELEINRLTLLGISKIPNCCKAMY